MLSCLCSTPFLTLKSGSSSRRTLTNHAFFLFALLPPRSPSKKPVKEIKIEKETVYNSTGTHNVCVYIGVRDRSAVLSTATKTYTPTSLSISVILATLPHEYLRMVHIPAPLPPKKKKKEEKKPLRMPTPSSQGRRDRTLTGAA